MTEKQIIAKIEDYMAKNNLRQWELARKLDVPDGTLNRWLKGRSNISRFYLKMLKEKGVV